MYAVICISDYRSLFSFPFLYNQPVTDSKSLPGDTLITSPSASRRRGADLTFRLLFGDQLLGHPRNLITSTMTQLWSASTDLERAVLEVFNRLVEMWSPTADGCLPSGPQSALIAATL